MLAMAEQRTSIGQNSMIKVPYSSLLHIPPTNYHLLAAKLESSQKAYLLMNNTGEFSGQKVRMAQ